MNETIKSKMTGKSNCCGEEMSVEGRTTHYYVCVKCLKPCDPKRPGSEVL